MTIRLMTIRPAPGDARSRADRAGGRMSANGTPAPAIAVMRMVKQRNGGRVSAAGEAM